MKRNFRGSDNRGDEREDEGMPEFTAQTRLDRRREEFREIVRLTRARGGCACRRAGSFFFFFLRFLYSENCDEKREIREADNLFACDRVQFSYNSREGFSLW